MKTVLFASALALSAALSTGAIASDNGMRPGDKLFGAAVEMTVSGHAMHVRGVKDSEGGEWIVLPRAEFETMLGHKVTMTFNSMENGK